MCLAADASALPGSGPARCPLEQALHEMVPSHTVFGGLVMEFGFHTQRKKSFPCLLDREFYSDEPTLAAIDLFE